MNSAIITSEVVNKVLRFLEEEMALTKEAISYEIQDNSNHLLISISVDGLLVSESPAALKRLGDRVNSLMPGRRGDYSWMVVFTKDGKVIDSYFGGDLDNPRSGL
jgi:hypothetical protein